MQILVIDESEIERSSIKEELALGSYDTLEASSIDEAINVLKKENIDLITLPYKLSDMNTSEICQALKKITDQKKKTTKSNTYIPLLMISANQSPKARSEGFEYGITNYIEKNFQKGQLVELIDDLLKPRLNYSGYKIAIVDDCHAQRTIIRKELERLNIKYTEFEDCSVAYDAIKKNPNDFSLIITSFDTPIMSGDIFCQKIRKELQLKDIPIILLTSNDHDNITYKLFQCGGSDYMQKPLHREEFQLRLFVHLERVEKLAEIKRLNEKLQESYKHMKEFTYAVSHDLRAPVRATKFYLQVLNEDFEEELSKEIKTYLNKINNSSDRMDELIVALLAYSKLSCEKISFRKSDTQALLEEVLEDLSYAIKESNATIHYDKLPVIEANHILLKQLMQNIIENSLKYKNCDLEPKIDIHIEEINSDIEEKIFYKFSFIDNGIGFDNEQKTKMFEAFKRLVRHEQYSGSGIGLSICKKIVEKHNGVISAHSPPEGGAIFSFILPKNQE